MEKEPMACAALPLRADESVYALVLGTREGMNSLLGGQSEKLQRRIDPAEWASRPEVRCLIGDEGTSVLPEEDDPENPVTLAGLAVKLLRIRHQKGLPGCTLLPCAPMPHNGEHLREAMIACAVAWRLPRDFLRWLVEENPCVSTLTDCSRWLIETATPLPVEQAEGSIQYVPDLTPYARRSQWMLGGAGVLLASAGMLLGVETVGAAMKDEDLRRLLGSALTREILPVLPDGLPEGLEYAARVCAYLENACREESWPATGENLTLRFAACLLPALTAYEKQNACLPPCLTFTLSALIMLYAGIRKKGEEYKLPTENGEAEVLDTPAACRAFSQFSCDMAPESLAYAALSDRDVWGCDLREIEGLEEAVTGWLRDMQLLGARTALQRAAALSE